jgi:hypothetical protein
MFDDITRNRGNLLVFWVCFAPRSKVLRGKLGFSDLLDL